MATTTATILLVETNNIGGRHSITCRPLSTPTGWLGGISRRFSSILFGGMHTMQNNDHVSGNVIRSPFFSIIILYANVVLYFCRN